MNTTTQKPPQQVLAEIDGFKPFRSMALPDQPEVIEALEFTEREVSDLEASMRERGITVPARPSCDGVIEQLDQLLAHKAKCRVLLSLSPAKMAEARQRVLATVGKTSTPAGPGKTTPAPAAPAALSIDQRVQAAIAARKRSKQ